MDQLRSLRIFTQVIASGSFAAAARALDLAPAVVTRAIADLEQHLGARLLNRSSRRLALTEIGATYLPNWMTPTPSPAPPQSAPAEPCESSARRPLRDTNWRASCPSFIGSTRTSIWNSAAQEP